MAYGPIESNFNNIKILDVIDTDTESWLIVVKVEPDQDKDLTVIGPGTIAKRISSADVIEKHGSVPPQSVIDAPDQDQWDQLFGAGEVELNKTIYRAIVEMKILSRVIRNKERMQTNIEYNVIYANDWVTLVDMVQDAIKNGWRPQGGMCSSIEEKPTYCQGVRQKHTVNRYFQAMIRNIKPTLTMSPKWDKDQESEYQKGK